MSQIWLCNTQSYFFSYQFIRRLNDSVNNFYHKIYQANAMLRLSFPFTVYSKKVDKTLIWFLFLRNWKLYSELYIHAIFVMDNYYWCESNFHFTSKKGTESKLMKDLKQKFRNLWVFIPILLNQTWCVFYEHRICFIELTISEEDF